MTGQNTSDDGLPNTTTKLEGTGMPATTCVVVRRDPVAPRRTVHGPDTVDEMDPIVRELYVGDGLLRMRPRARRRIVQAMLERYGLD